MMDILDRALLAVSGWRLLDERGDFSVVRRGATTQLRSKVFTVYSTSKQGTIYTGSYWDYLVPPAAMYGKPRVLMIGLGGGTVAIQLRSLFPDAVIDAVESSADVVALSQKYFLKGANVGATVSDGAAYLSKCGTYDVIILDAFVGLSVPSQFTTDEFLARVDRALSSHGTFVVNFIGSGLERHSYSLLLKKRFKTYAITPPLLNNTILVCSKHLSRSEIASRISKRMCEDERQQALARAYAHMKEL